MGNNNSQSATVGDVGATLVYNGRTGHCHAIGAPPSRYSHTYTFNLYNKKTGERRTEKIVNDGYDKVNRRLRVDRATRSFIVDTNGRSKTYYI
jgi:hypothetical protein